MTIEGVDDLDFLDGLELDGRVTTDPDVLEAYSHDEGPHPAHRPDVAVHAESTADVSAVLDACHDHGVAVTPRSGGSSIEGNPIPVAGGVVLDTLPMDAIDVRPADRLAVVGPGIVYNDLNRELNHTGCGSHRGSLPATSRRSAGWWRITPAG